MSQTNVMGSLSLGNIDIEKTEFLYKLKYSSILEPNPRPTSHNNKYNVLST